jgi:hypothetical protein
MSDTPEPTTKVAISAAAMILFGLLMIAVGGVYGVMLVVVFLHSRTIGLTVIVGLCGAVCVGGGVWLIKSGVRVLLTLLMGRRDFDD